MRFASIGSGSGGNGTLVQSGDTTILIDCGFPLGETLRRLARAGVPAESLSAVCVTHEHSDHVAGVAKLAARYELPVYASLGSWRSMEGSAPARLFRRLIADVPEQIGALRITPVPVPHDAREPLQFVVDDGCERVGVLTDVGSLTPHMVSCYSSLDALVLECNHDAGMLASGPYPAFLKSRVGGALGHLSNDQSVAFLDAIDRQSLKHLVAAHLSAKNNTPGLVRAALGSIAAAHTALHVQIADQAAGLEWVCV